MDTPDAAYNPVSGRIEAIIPKRNEGFPFCDNGCRTLSIWSLSPEEFEAGKTDWRFDCTLYRSQGMMSGSEDPAFPKREGLHPAGAVIDEARGVQHIFIFTGDNPHIAKKSDEGAVGLFRITRSLDTSCLVTRLRALAPRATLCDLDAPLPDSEQWTPCGAPPVYEMLDKNRVRLQVVPAVEGTVRFEQDGLLLTVDKPGYAGVYCQSAMAPSDYELVFDAKVERLAKSGVTLGITVNHGPRRHRMALCADGFRVSQKADSPFDLLVPMTIDQDWHHWTVAVSGNRALVSVDGQHLGEHPLGFDDRLGINDAPILMWARIEEDRDAAKVWLRNVCITNKIK